MALATRTRLEAALASLPLAMGQPGQLLAEALSAIAEMVEAASRTRDIIITPPVSDPRQLLRASEAAQMLGISKSALYELHRRGRLPSVRPTGENGAFRFRIEDLQTYSRDPEAFVPESLIPAAFRPQPRRHQTGQSGVR